MGLIEFRVVHRILTKQSNKLILGQELILKALAEGKTIPKRERRLAEATFFE